MQLSEAKIAPLSMGTDNQTQNTLAGFFSLYCGDRFNKELASSIKLWKHCLCLKAQVTMLVIFKIAHLLP